MKGSKSIAMHRWYDNRPNEYKIIINWYSFIKDPVVMVACTICKQQIRMIKKNEQARVHVDSKHSGKPFAECFPGYTCG